MIKRIARQLYNTFVPASIRQRQADRALLKAASEFKRECDGISSFEEIISAHRTTPLFIMEQLQREIAALCELLSNKKPQIVCEIGARRGGSTSLYTHVLPDDAQIFSIDLNYTEGRMKAIESFARGKQRIQCIQADSHSNATLEKLRTLLAGKPIDFLFIDGDHSYAGVKQDFDMFTPLVRNGGIVALHDIVQDYFARYGRRTSSDAGQVPAYWKELKAAGYTTRDLIEDPEQDGFGIGVIEWKGGVA